MAWIRGLREQPDRIQRILDQIAEQEEPLITDDLEEHYLPHSKIPSGRIHFRFYWKEQSLSRAASGIVFFQVPWNGDDLEADVKIFTLLTGVLKKHDPEGRLLLSVYDWEDYEDMVDKLLKIEGESNDPEHRYDYPAQIIWLLDGIIIHNSFVGEEDIQLLEKYTLDLLNRLTSDG